jgi:hypothetical protein
MIGNIRGAITIPLQETYSIDTTKRESLSTSTATRQIKDSDYGGHGEQITTVPTIQQITYQGATSSALSAMASNAQGGQVSTTTQTCVIVKLQSTNIKGVVV